MRSGIPFALGSIAAAVLVAGNPLPVRAQAGARSAIGVRWSQAATRADVPLFLVDRARPVVEVMLNGHGPFRLGIETGGPYAMVLTARAATAAQVGSVAGSGRTVDSLRIGPLTLTNLATGVQPGLPFPGVDGLLGLRAFDSVAMTIDYAQKNVRFERTGSSSETTKDAMPLVPVSMILGVQGTVAGRRVPLVIDTQGGVAIMCPPNIADSLPWMLPPVSTGQAAISGTAPVVTRSARLAGNITFGTFTLERPIVSVTPIPTGFPPLGGCLLGVDILKEFTFTLDQAAGTARFSRGNPVIGPAAPLRTVGVSVFASPDGQLRIMAVAPGGAGEAAGVHAGDVVIAIDGVSATFDNTRRLGGDGRPVHIQVSRDGVALEFRLTPRTLVE